MRMDKRKKKGQYSQVYKEYKVCFYMNPLVYVVHTLEEIMKMKCVAGFMNLMKTNLRLKT